jgi:hypothetical protein
LVEHATENRSVGGSIPSLGTTPEILKTSDFHRKFHLGLSKWRHAPSMDPRLCMRIQNRVISLHRGAARF